MFSKKLLLSLLLIALIISVGCVNAVDSSNWKTVKVNDVDFKIPPKYQGGEINTARTNYHYNDLNTFGILCVDDYLPSSYGCWYNFKGKNLTIGSHDVHTSMSIITLQNIMCLMLIFHQKIQYTAYHGAAEK